jgi:Fur family transcriptional regulator, peroxide stress response regulator
MNFLQLLLDNNQSILIIRIITNMATTRRNSKQRERIFELIKKSANHPIAQMIYEMLKKETRSLSIGNVYRNLRILIEQGRIISRDFGDGIEHFDAMTHIHYHFICEKCESVSDFTMPVQESITKDAQRLSKHTITSHTIQFYGICENCKKKLRL